MNKIHVKKGDTVVVISGRKDTKQKDGIIGKKGKVLEVSPKEGKVIVEGINMLKKHVKPKKQGQAGGILDIEGPLNASKVMLVCPNCGKPTRVGHTKIQDGNKTKTVRVCKNENCRETF